MKSIQSMEAKTNSNNTFASSHLSLRPLLNSHPWNCSSYLQYRPIRRSNFPCSIALKKNFNGGDELQELKSLTNRLQMENDNIKEKLELCSREYNNQVSLAWKVLRDLYTFVSTRKMIQIKQQLFFIGSICVI